MTASHLRCKMASTNESGTNTIDPFDDTELSDDGDNARFSAELIQDAVRNLDKSDRLSLYERRVALREIKDMIAQLLDDTQTIPGSMKVKEYLLRDENSDTADQIVVLRNELLRLMRHADTLGMEVVTTCRKISAAWESAGHSPQDLFEVQIKFSPKTIHASPLVISVLHAMLEVWSPDEGAPSSDDDCGGIDLKTLLQGIGVNGETAKLILKATEGNTHARRSQVSRITSALDELEELHKLVGALDRIPKNSPYPSERSATKLAQREGWLVAALKVQTAVKRWELLSGVPYSSPCGPQLFLKHGDAEESWSFSELLDRAIRQIERGE